MSVKLFCWLEYLIQKSRTSLSNRSQFVDICVVCELKMNCSHLIFILEANMFMVSAASVDDKMIKFLQIKIS